MVGLADGVGVRDGVAVGLGGTAVIVGVGFGFLVGVADGLGDGEEVA